MICSPGSYRFSELKATLVLVDYFGVVVIIRLSSVLTVESARLWWRQRRAALFALCLCAPGAITADSLIVAAPPADVPANLVNEIAPHSSQRDPRFVRLETFFNYYRCDAPHHTSEYLRAADVYGLDYRLLPAISIRETSCGKGARQENNFWGFHPGRQSFSSVAAGIDFLAHRVMQHPAYKGKSLRDKLFTYNPFPNYPDEVVRIMRQIE